MGSYWQLNKITKRTKIHSETDYYDGHVAKQRQMHETGFSIFIADHTSQEKDEE